GQIVTRSAGRTYYLITIVVSVLFNNTFGDQMRRGTSRSIRQGNKSPVFEAASGLATRAIRVERTGLKVLLSATRNWAVATVNTCRQPNIKSMARIMSSVSWPV